MRSIGVRELRQNASAVLRKVEAGATFQVTDRGRPVAVLGPLSDAHRAASPLEQLRASGETEPAKRSLDELPPPLGAARARLRITPISDALTQLRTHER